MSRCSVGVLAACNRFVSPLAGQPGVCQSLSAYYDKVFYSVNTHLMPLILCCCYSQRNREMCQLKTVHFTCMRFVFNLYFFRACIKSFNGLKEKKKWNHNLPLLPEDTGVPDRAEQRSERKSEEGGRVIIT